MFFGLLFHHGNSPAGREVVDRIVCIHSRFPIHNDLKLYTLFTLACLPTRIGREFVGRDLIGPREQLAMYEFWREVGEMMGIRDIPGSAEKMLRWSIDYERAEYATTKDGVEVTAALAREFAQRWFPAPLQARGERVFYALFDDHLRQTHGIAPPTAAERRVVLAAVRGFVRAVDLLPDSAERDLVGMFGQRYRGQVAPSAAGPQE